MAAPPAPRPPTKQGPPAFVTWSTLRRNLLIGKPNSRPFPRRRPNAPTALLAIRNLGCPFRTASWRCIRHLRFPSEGDPQPASVSRIRHLGFPAFATWGALGYGYP